MDPPERCEGYLPSMRPESKTSLFCAWEGEKGISAISKSQAGLILCKKAFMDV